MSITIRESTVADVPALAALRRGVRQSNDDPDFEARFAAWSAAEGDRRTTWVAEDDAADGPPRAAAALTGRSALLPHWGHGNTGQPTAWDARLPPRREGAA